MQDAIFITQTDASGIHTSYYPLGRKTRFADDHFVANVEIMIAGEKEGGYDIREQGGATCGHGEGNQGDRAGKGQQYILKTQLIQKGYGKKNPKQCFHDRSENVAKPELRVRELEEEPQYAHNYPNNEYADEKVKQKCRQIRLEALTDVHDMIDETSTEIE
jgi:hypothetical protein